MNVGELRAALAGMADHALIRLHMVEAPDGCFVALEKIAPSLARSALDVFVSVLHDDEDDADSEGD